jgi:hypothetical protein
VSHLVNPLLDIFVSYIEAAKSTWMLGTHWLNTVSVHSNFFL